MKPDARNQIAESPELAALVRKMKLAQARRRKKTPWVTDATRAEMLRRYEEVLDVMTEDRLTDFLRWVVDDARYLSAAGNFAEYCHDYLTAELDEAPELWAMTK